MGGASQASAGASKCMQRRRVGGMRRRDFGVGAAADRCAVRVGQGVRGQGSCCRATGAPCAQPLSQSVALGLRIEVVLMEAGE